MESTLVWQYWWFSIWESVVTVILSVSIGGALAGLAPRRWFQAVMLLPIFLPPAILALGFITVWGTTGYVNHLLFWLQLPTQHWLYSAWAVIASHCYYNIPLAYLAIQLSLTSSHNDLEDAAASLGANRFKQWWLVTLPRLRSTLIGVSLLIFLYAFMSFALPLILGGNHYQTVEVYIYQLITQQHNLTAALRSAGLQWLGLTAILVLVYHRGVVIPTTQIQPINHPDARLRCVSTIIQLFSACAVFLPVAAVIQSGLQIKQLTILLQTGFALITLRTLLLAIVVALLTGFVALLIVQVLPDYLQRSNLLLLTISPVTLGVLWKLSTAQSLLQLGLAYSLILLPVMVLWLRVLWLARPPRFNETLQVLGATPHQRWLANNRWLLPALVQGITMGMIMVLGDITLSILLVPYNAPTMMSYSYKLLGSYRFSLAATGMTITLLTIAAIITGSALAQYYYAQRYATRRS